MKRRALAVLFALLCLAQMGAAFSMIVRYEGTLRSGTPYQIEVALVDPADAFRGRYVAIQPRLLAAGPPGEGAAAIRERLGTWNQTVHVTLEAGPDGFARVREVFAEPPGSGDYLTARSAGPRHEWIERTDGPPEPKLLGFDLILPFDRYYMKENLAPAAEKAYREAVGRGQEKRAWIIVRARNGMGVVEGLYLDGVPIETVAAAGAAASPP